MRPAIEDLSQLRDDELFTVVSEGIKHIIENALEFDRIGKKLFNEGEKRGWNIMQVLTEEEAAKALVLIDYVRCPRSKSAESARVLRSFDDHVAKGISAEACDWRPALFRDICSYVELELAGFYLDGPHEVDWIFGNDLVAARDRSMYVDYVHDGTVEGGDHNWQLPVDNNTHLDKRSKPSALKIVLALAQCGATSEPGLRVVADKWRKFEPKSCSTRLELMGLIIETLETFKAKNLCPFVSGVAQRTVLDGWAFPLWSLDIRYIRNRSSENELLRKLREERVAKRARWIEIEKRRETDLVVSRKTVERLSKAFNEWQNDIDEIRDDHFKDQGQGLKIETGSLMQRYDELDSCKQLEHMLGELSRSERIDLLALAWFSRRRPFDWPQQRRQAEAMIDGFDYKYQTGLGKDWLGGLELWESGPELPATFETV